MKDLFTKQQRKFGTAEEGGALVLVALATMCLLMMAGLGIDVGYLKYQKQQMRKAADAGVIAAATVLSYSGDISKATVSARHEASANGFQDGSGGITVAVNNGPTSGPFAGNANYVEVIVAQARPTFFMGVTGTHGVNVRGRAVAYLNGNASGCMYAMDPTSGRSFLVDGGVSLTSNCGIYVNSNNSTEALRENGNSSAITVSSTGVGIGVVGGYNGSTFTPTPVTGIPPFTDPLATVPAPTFNPSNCALNPPTDPHHYTPGVYCGGIRISASGTYTFDAGTYVLYGGGMTVTGNASLVGQGVTFYNTGQATGGNRFGNISFAGGTNTVLSAPTSGPLKGMLFFQDRAFMSTSNPDTSVFNTALGTYTGAIYFPGTPIKFAGNPTVGAYTTLVAWQITIDGNTMINVSGDIAGGSPVTSALLVE